MGLDFTESGNTDASVRRGLSSITESCWYMTAGTLSVHVAVAVVRYRLAQMRPVSIITLLHNALSIYTPAVCCYSADVITAL